MGKISNSVELAKASLKVLNQDKVLAGIPVASAITCGVAVLAFGGVGYLTLEHVTNPAPGQNEWSATPLTWSVGIIGVFVVGMIAQFFAAVLIAGANERLEGGDPTLASAYRRAAGRAPSIFGWAAINSSVGLVLSAIREKAGFLGVAVTSVIGFAWNVITWLAVPIIIVEGLGPIAAIKRSAQLLRQTWGENLIAQMGFGAVGMVAMLPGIVVFGALTFVVPIVGIPLLLLYVAAVSAVLAALSAIYRTALYRFAAGLPAGDAFPAEALSGAFGPKGSGLGRRR